MSLLVGFFNRIWMEGIIPTAWKHAVILPLRKPDKPHQDPNSYRPISLTSCMCKILERVVTDRLVHYLESNNILNPAQTGFRKGLSTIDQILKLTD